MELYFTFFPGVLLLLTIGGIISDYLNRMGIIWNLSPRARNGMHI